MFKKIFKAINKFFSKVINFIKKHWKKILIALAIALCIYGFYYFAFICEGSFSMFATHVGSGIRAVVSGFVSNPVVEEVIKKAILPITVTAVVSKNKWLIILAVIMVSLLVLRGRQNEPAN